jgi:O-antigen/teichoic acid export membrane protein
LVREWGRAARAYLEGSHSGIRDVVISMIPQGVRVVSGVVTYVLLARGLGPAGLGEYALCLSVAEVTGQLSELGLGQTGARFAARAFALGDREGQMAILRWAFRMRMLVVLLACALVFLAAPFFVPRLWHDARLTPLVRLAIPNAAFLALASVPITYFQSEKRFGQNALVMGGQAMFSLLGVVVLFLLGVWSVRTAILAMVISTGVGAFRFLLRIPREAWWPRRGMAPVLGLSSFWSSPQLKQDPDSIEEHRPMRFASFLFLSSMISLIGGKLDLWLIGNYLDVAQVGVYSAAGRLSLPLAIVLAAFNTVLLPRAASATTLAATRSLAIRTLKASLLLAGAGAIYSFFGPVIIPLIFGHTFQSSVLIARLLCLGQCIAILFCPVGLIGYNLGLVRLYWITNLLQLGATVATLLILLPRLGAVAGALAFLANISVGGLVNGFLVLQRLREDG